MSLLGSAGFSGGTFGDTCCVNFGWCVNSGKVATIKEALLSGKIVQDDWTEFALRMIQKGIEDGWLKSGSGEYEKLLCDVVAYSMFNDEKKEIDCEFYQRMFLECIAHWFSTERVRVYVNNNHTPREVEMTKGEWMIWETVVTVGKKRLAKTVNSLIYNCVMKEKEGLLKAKTGWLFFENITQDDIEDFRNPQGIYIEKLV